MTRWRSGAFAFAVVVLAVCSACGTRGPARPTVVQPEPSIPIVFPPAAGARLAAGSPLVRGMDLFGGDLAPLVGRSGTNTVFSPFSISTALSLVRAGASGPTATEIDRVAHYPSTGRDASFSTLLHDIATTTAAPPVPTASPSEDSGTGAPPRPVVTIADGVFTQDEKQLSQSFVNTLSSSYGASVQTVDFTKPSANEVLNAWVTEHTAHRITKLFDQLSPGTQLVLANAVYLKAAWAIPFGHQDTTPAPFHTTTNATVQVPTMHQTLDQSYAETRDWQAVELPYAGGTLAMLLVLPRTATDPTPLLHGATLEKARASLSGKLVELSLPTWKTTSDVDLLPILERLGIVTAFRPAADFSRIAPGLFIGQAVHRATITVDEDGTEAAAVTAFGFVTGAVSGPPPVPVVMKLDHPFAYAVIDTKYGTPLFTGVVSNPAQRP